MRDPRRGRRPSWRTPAGRANFDHGFESGPTSLGSPSVSLLKQSDEVETKVDLRYFFKKFMQLPFDKV